jgi:hypothetical protein
MVINMCVISPSLISSHMHSLMPTCSAYYHLSRLNANSGIQGKTMLNILDWKPLCLSAIRPPMLSPLLERKGYLLILERDIRYLEYVFCHYCYMLHRPQDCTPKSTLWQSALDRSSREWELRHPYSALVHQFKFQNARMNTKLNNMGFATREALYTEVVRQAELNGCHHEWHPSIEAIRTQAETRTINGRFYTRVQKWMLLTEDKDLRRLPVHICPHCYWDGGTQPPRIGTNHFYEYLNLLQKKLTNSVQARCWGCFTEFQMDLLSLDDGRVVFAITTWLDFGPMRSPFQQHWTSHFQHRGRMRNTLEWTQGTILAAFEGPDWEDFHIISLLTKEAVLELLQSEAFSVQVTRDCLINNKGEHQVYFFFSSVSIPHIKISL